jgi:uncharacterized protein YjbI with pentapeptide repeats
MKDEKLIKKYKDYYNYQYSVNARLGLAVDNALEASVKIPDFSSAYNKEIVAISNFKNFLKEARKDILVILSVLNNIYESDQISISSLLNNANNSIAQIRYRESAVTDFIAIIESYLAGKNSHDYSQLKKAHDMLLMNQFSNAVITKNKPLLKYLDNKNFYATTKEFKTDYDLETVKFKKSIKNELSDIYTGDISNTDVVNTDIINTDIINTDIINTDIINTDIVNTDVVNTDVVNTDVVNTDVVNTDVVNTDAVNTDVVNTDVMNTDMFNTDLFNTDLFNTDLFNTDLFNTDLFNTDIFNTDNTESNN